MACITNKKLGYDYEILKTITAGISLLGTEVKSIKSGKGSLVGARVVARGGEAFLVGANIPPYQEKNVSPRYDPKRTRKLLLSKKEILFLQQKEEENIALLPKSIYNAKRKLKLEIILGKKKKLHDKREKIKKREAERDMRRSAKS